MAIKKFEVIVTQTVIVEIDDEHLNDEFNKEFSEDMWEVSGNKDHAAHIGTLKAVGQIDEYMYVEGYGDIRELNCKAIVRDLHVETEAL